ncbi:MAG TPA: hypothetical protein VMW27_16005 [Thermoanaerobaculia bacterium]|nr:hypothetical protein [Thermoanaerobaculia bacterium]
MFILDSLLVGGLRFVFDKVASAVDAEMNDTDRLREDLLAAQMQYELGELSDDELAGIEADLLARMRALRGGPEAAGPVSFTEGGGFEVDVMFGGDEDEE